MPQKSGFFNSTADDMREYSAQDFAEYFAKFITNGVFNGGQFLNPTATGLDAYISLSVGSAWINGYVYSVYDSALVLPIEPAAALDRIDRIILRLDTSTPVRNIRAIVLQGLPGSNPNPPALVRSGNIYDLSIAQVRVKANSTIVLPANIKDERLDNAVCGLVNSLIRVDTTTFQQQWDAFITSVQNQGFVTTTVFNARLADTEANSKAYSDAQSKLASYSNLLPNSTGLLGMTGWTYDTGWTANAYFDERPMYFSIPLATTTSRAYSDPVFVAVGTQYTVSVDFFTYGQTSGQMFIDVVDETQTKQIGLVYATLNSNWHRRSTTFIVPSGVSSVRVRMYSLNMAVSDKAFARIMLNKGSVEVPWNDTASEKLLFQSGVDAKNGAVASLNAMGVSASASDNWAMIATKIRTIATGKKYQVGQLNITNGVGSINNLTFIPRNVIIAQASQISSSFGAVYSADALKYKIGGGSEITNHLFGFGNSSAYDNVITPTNNGFKFDSAAMGTTSPGGVFNYFATE